MVYGNIAISGVVKQVHNIVNHAILHIKTPAALQGIGTLSPQVFVRLVEAMDDSIIAALFPDADI